MWTRLSDNSTKPSYIKIWEQTFPPRPVGLEKPKRSFTEAFTVFCGEQKHRDKMRSEMRKRKHKYKHTIRNSLSHTFTCRAPPGSCEVSGWAVGRGPSRSFTDCFSVVTTGCWAVCMFYKQQTWLRQSDFTAGTIWYMKPFMHTDHDVCLIHSAVRSCTIKRLNTVRICTVNYVRIFLCCGKRY